MGTLPYSNDNVDVFFASTYSRYLTFLLSCLLWKISFDTLSTIPIKDNELWRMTHFFTYKEVYGHVEVIEILFHIVICCCLSSSPYVLSIRKACAPEGGTLAI
jgi:hypothetical protein